MKKRIAFRKLNRTPAHKWSMLRNMVSSLIEHERIVTTQAKAKELRHLADQMITLAKKGQLKQPQHQNQALLEETKSNNSNNNNNNNTKTPGELLHHRRRASRIVRGDWNVTKLFEVLGPRYEFREGGYTRVMKLARNRAGDNAPMAVIEYVDRPGEIRAARPPSVFRNASANASANKNKKNDTIANATVMNGVEDALKRMGIAPVDELVSNEERQSIESELQNDATADADAEDKGSSSKV